MLKKQGRDTIMEYGEGDDDKDGETYTGEPDREIPVQPASEVAKKPQQSPALDREKPQGKRGGGGGGGGGGETEQDSTGPIGG